MLRGLFLSIGLCAALAVAGCGGGSSSNGESQGGSTVAQSKPKEAGEAAGERTKPTVDVPKGPPPKKLEIKELIPGTGAVAKSGDEVTVQYVGVDYKTGKQFDASWDRGEPFSFPLGANEVISGWDKGVEGMKVGGRRELIIPPNLAYGSQQVGPIAPNSTLVFVIDLLAVH
jgi:peptidylprolyl isomerase